MHVQLFALYYIFVRQVSVLPVISSHVTALTSGQTGQLLAPSLYFPVPQSDFQALHYPFTKALLASVHEHLPSAKVKGGVDGLHVLHFPVS